MEYKWWMMDRGPWAMNHGRWGMYDVGRCAMVRVWRMTVHGCWVICGGDWRAAVIVNGGADDGDRNGCC